MDKWQMRICKLPLFHVDKLSTYNFRDCKIYFTGNSVIYSVLNMVCVLEHLFSLWLHFTMDRNIMFLYEWVSRISVSKWEWMI